MHVCMYIYIIIYIYTHIHVYSYPCIISICKNNTYTCMFHTLFLHKRGRHIERNSPSHGGGGGGRGGGVKRGPSVYFKIS